MSANSLIKILFSCIILIQTQAKGISLMQHKLQKIYTNGSDKLIPDLQNDHRNYRPSVILDEREAVRPKKEILSNFINKLRGDIEELQKSNENLRLENYELINILANAGEDENNNTYKTFKTEIEELRNITNALHQENDELHHQLNDKSFEKLRNQIEELLNLTIKVSAEEKEQMFESCEAALSIESNHDGVYELYLPKSGLDSFKVYCMRDENNNGSAWTIVLRRQDGTINFYRPWKEYEHGFGNVSGEYFIGLQQLHALTQAARQELYVKLMDFENNTRFAKYDWFIVGDAANKYPLESLGNYYGDAGDSLAYHKGRQFSTMDDDNSDANCAEGLKGANWYYFCQKSSLFGPYKHKHEKILNAVKYGVGVTWFSWRGNKYSLKYAHMALRPVN